MLKLTKCNEKSFVKFIIDGSTLTLCAYDEIVHKLAAAIDTGVGESFLSLPLMNFTYNKKHTVTDACV